MVSTLDPSQFQALAMAWLGVFTILIGAALTAIITLWPKVTELRGLMDSQHATVTANQEAITRLSKAVGEHEAVVQLTKSRLDALSPPSVQLVPPPVQEPPV